MPSLTILVFKEKKKVRVEKNIKKEKMEKVGEIDLEGNASLICKFSRVAVPISTLPSPCGLHYLLTQRAIGSLTNLR